MTDIHQKLNSANELKAKIEQAKQRQQQYQRRILICMTGCRALGAKEVAKTFRDELSRTNLKNDNIVIKHPINLGNNPF